MLRPAALSGRPGACPRTCRTPLPTSWAMPWASTTPRTRAPRCTPAPSWGRPPSGSWTTGASSSCARRTRPADPRSTVTEPLWTSARTRPARAPPPREDPSPFLASRCWACGGGEGADAGHRLLRFRRDAHRRQLGPAVDPPRAARREHHPPPVPPRRGLDVPLPDGLGVDGRRAPDRHRLAPGTERAGAPGAHPRLLRDRGPDALPHRSTAGAGAAPGVW